MTETTTESVAPADLTDPEQVQEELNKQCDIILNPRFRANLAACYQFSKEYDEVWNREWDRYAELEAARKACGAERLDWQDTVEEWRTMNDGDKAASYVDSLAGVFDKTPLMDCLHMFRVEVLGETPLLDRIYGWRSARENWDLFRRLYETHTEKMLEYLSVVQRTSFCVLADWWDSRYSPRDDMDAFRARVEELAPKGTIWQPTSASKTSGWQCHSNYHSACMELFMREFHPMEWEPFTPRPALKNLQAVRGNTIRHAMSMRHAYFVLRGGGPSRNDASPPVPPYPQHARDTQAWGDNIFFQEPPPDDIGHSMWKNLMDLSVSPPGYLWDVRGKRTIKVSELPACPEYVCVSHTWGRWCVRPPSLVDVPGVPWQIKENTLYDVRDVPEMMLGLGQDYIWLDLFCLPQDDSPEHHQEVANQTGIFRRAKSCVAWLNDVEGWDGTRAALDYIGLKYLRTTTSGDAQGGLAVDDDAFLACTAAASERRLDFVKTDAKILEPSSWFTSLWCLQEAALCPNLQLCTRTMELLVDRTGAPIGLATLMGILRPPTTVPTFLPAAWPAGLPMHTQPGSVTKLHALSEWTRLGWMLEYLSPMDVMVVSNLRACKRSRAVAIMNALDCVDWYKRDAESAAKSGSTAAGGGGGGAEENLVLGTFPLEFVREAARKFGSSFYTAVTRVNALRVEKFEGLMGYGDIEVGSMMPFSKVHGWATSVTAALTIQTLRRRDHESVASWTVEPNASVRIRSAGILSCSSDDQHHPTAAISSLVVTLGEDKDGKVSSSTHRDGRADLHATLRELAGSKMVYYAVVLFDDFGQQFGIILQGPRTRLPKPGRKWLIKIGYFRTHDFVTEPVKSTAVNWVIV